MDSNKKNYTLSETVLPVIPLRGLWMFPHMVMHFDVGRIKSVNALENALLNHSQIFVATQKNYMDEDPELEDIYPVGTIVDIKQTLKLASGTIRVLVEGTDRGELLSFTKRDKYLEGKINRVVYDEKQDISPETEAAMRLVLADMKEFLQHSKGLGGELFFGLKDIKEPGRLADVVGSYVGFSDEQHQEILGELNEYKRLILLHSMLQTEIEFLKLEEKINRKVMKQINESQKEYYLKEQIQAIEKIRRDRRRRNFGAGVSKKLDKLDMEKQLRKIEKDYRLSHTPINRRKIM